MAMGDAKEVRRRVFISNANGQVGRGLLEKFPERFGDWEILGTRGAGVAALGNEGDGGRLVFVEGEARCRAALDCDVVVLCATDDIEEAEEIVAAMQLGYASADCSRLPSKLILVVGLGTWSATWGGEGGDGDGASGEAGVGDQRLANLSEVDFERRRPAHRYRKQLLLEQAVLRLNSALGMQAIIVGAGIVYGKGEGPLYPIFHNAWLTGGIGVKLPCINESTAQECRPLLVSADNLCEFISSLTTGDFITDKQYILAVDEARPSLGEICEAISSAAAGANDDPAPVIGVMTKEEYLKHFLKWPSWTTQLLLSFPLAPPGDENTYAKYRGASFLDLVDESYRNFTQYCHLKPLRLLITGPPGARVKELCLELSNRLSVPLLDARTAADALLVACKLPVPERPSSQSSSESEAPRQVGSKGTGAKAGSKAKKRELQEDMSLPLEQRLLSRLKTELEMGGVDLSNSTYGGLSSHGLLNLISGGNLAKDLLKWYLMTPTVTKFGFISVDFPLNATTSSPPSLDSALSCFLEETKETDQGDELGPRYYSMDKSRGLDYIVYIDRPVSLTETSADGEGYVAYCEAEELNADPGDKEHEEETGNILRKELQLPRTLRAIRAEVPHLKLLGLRDASSTLPCGGVIQHIGGVPGWASKSADHSSALGDPLIDENATNDHTNSQNIVIDSEVDDADKTAQEQLSTSLEMVIRELSTTDRQKLDEISSNLRRYLLDNVAPEIAKAMLEMRSLPPESVEDPIDWLGDYLIREGQRKQKKAEAEADLRYQAGLALLEEQHHIALQEADQMGG